MGRKQKQIKQTVAVVIAWRKGETDLAATVESAKASLGSGGQILTVEDTQAQGPGRTRHRGIVASDADVILIADSHMRFQGGALAKMAAWACMNQGVACCLTHHNADCAFDGNPYAGARIVYRAKDARSYTALAGKWSKDGKPGPRGCIMGGCYAFRRDWYNSVGQPLSMLTGWGCDEEILSIASWLSGDTPVCLDAVVAHRWRPNPPWRVAPSEYAAVRSGRMDLIRAVVTEATARRELEQWTREGVAEGASGTDTPEVERVRQALLRLPRKWADWRAQVCEPDEYDGVQERKPREVDAPARRIPVQNPVVLRVGIKCPHCSDVFEHLPKSHQYPNGNKRHHCPTCGNYFISAACRNTCPK